MSADTEATKAAGFTEKQLSVGKEEFERRLAGLREYAYSDAHPILTRSIVWEVAYVDGLLAEVERLRAALETERDRHMATMAWLKGASAERDALRRPAVVETETEDHSLRDHEGDAEAYEWWRSQQ